MKQRIINGHALEFFDSSNTKKGEIKISGSDIIINPLDGNGTVIFGEQGTVNDIEVGAVGTPVDFTFAGGGTITSNGGTLTIGTTGDTIDLSNATIGAITASAFVGGTFEGDGSGLTGVVPDLSGYNGNVVVTGSLQVTGRVTAEEFHTEFVSASIIYQSGSTKFGDTFDDVHTFTGSISLLNNRGGTVNDIFVVSVDYGELLNVSKGNIKIGKDGRTDTNTTIQGGSLSVNASSTTNLFVSSSGNVGIGTTDPRYATLQVQGSGLFSGTLQVQGNINLREDIYTLAHNGLSFIPTVTRYDGGSELGLDYDYVRSINGNNGGNVGIGTTSPTRTLEIGTDGGGEKILKIHSDTASSYFEIQSLGNVARLLATNNTNLLLQSDGSGGYITFNANSAERMRIDSAGNVGIGTNNPLAGLEVANAENSTLRLTRNSNNGNYLQLQGGSSGAIYNINTSGTQDHIFQTGGNEKMRLTSAGNVGIGIASPNAKLTIGNNNYNGNLAVAESSNNNRVALIGNLEIVNNSTGGTWSGQSIYIPGANRTFGFRGSGALNAADSSAFEFNAVVNSNRTVDYTSFNLKGGYSTNTLAADYTFMKIDGNIYQGGINQSGSITGIDYNPAISQLTGSHTAMRLRSGDVLIEDGDLTVGGTVTAQEFHTEFVSASIIYQSGSTKFGNTSDDVHQFTGSLQVLGAINRPFSLTDGRAFHKGESGGWRLEYGFKGSSGTDRGGFGAQGGNDTVTYYYIGSNQTNPTLAATPAGNVGIGTTSPSEKLTVEGNISASGNIYIQGALLLDGADGLRFNQGGSSVFSPSPGIFYSGTSGQGWYFQVPDNGQEKFSFKLGGTSAGREFRVVDPSWNPLFQVQGTGDAIIANNLTVGGTVTAQEFHTEFVSASIVYQSGSTKFGDTSDDVHSFTGSTHIQSGSYKIDTYGEGLRWYDGTNYNVNRIQLSSAQNMQLQAGGVIQLQSPTQIVNGNELTFNNSGNTTRFDINNAGGTNEYRLDFSSGSTQLMVISGSGNVGIGTTSPQKLLDVNGDVRFKRNIYGADGNYIGFFTDGGSALPIKVASLTISNTYNDTAPNYGLYVKGDAGIGTTTPRAKLDIQDSTHGTLMLSRPSETGYAMISGSSGLGFEFKTYDAGEVMAMKIANDGKVGIGTTAPFRTLDVRGSTVISGSFSGADANALVLDNTDSSGNPSIMRMIFSGEGGNEALQIGMFSSPTTKPVYFQSTQGSGWGNIVFQRYGGQVGIRTLEPSANLTVQGNGTTTGKTFLAQDSNASALFTILDNGNIGIGTTSPSEKLEVAGKAIVRRTGTATAHTDTDLFVTDATAAGSTAQIEILGGNAGNSMLYFSDPDSYSQGAIQYLHSTDNMNIRVNGSTAMTIDSSRNVGIGTTSPTNKLDVAGAISTTTGIRVGSAIAGEWIKRVASPTVSNGIDLQSQGVSRLFAGSNVGIGTTSPTYKLHIVDPAPSSWGGLSGSLNVDDILIVSSSSVGIGTTTPSARLHVSGTADVLLIEGSGSTANTSIFAIDGNNGRLFEVSDDLSDSLFSVNTIAGLPVMEVFSDNRVIMGAFNQNDLVISGSKVGIGTATPAHKLSVDGNIQLPNGGFIYGQSTGNYLKLDNATYVELGYSSTTAVRADGSAVSIRGTGGTSRLTVQSAGNVGINTTSPTALLEIKGSGIVSTDTHFRVVEAAGTGNLFRVNQRETIARFLTGSDGILLPTNQAVNYGSSTVYTKRDSTLNAFVYSQGGTEHFAIKDGGNVGIGTTSPAHKLDVSGDINIPLGSNYLRFGGQLGIKKVSNGAMHFYAGTNTTTGGFDFATWNGSTYDEGSFVIRNNGNVGIGTTSPSTKLHVATSTSGGNPSVIIQDNGRGQTGTLNYVSFTEANGSSQAKVGFQSTLNGTFTLANLIGDVDISSTGQVRAIASSNFIVQTAGNPHFIVNNSGDVGIGTTSPANKLHVTNGQIQIGDSTSNHFGLRLTRTNASVVQDAHLYSPSANSPSVFYMEGGYWTGENTGTVTAANSGHAYYEKYFGNGANTSFKYFGFAKVANGNFTVNDMTASLTLKSDGTVGIGTALPSHTLDVAQVADNQGIKLSGYDDQSSRTYSQYVDQNGHITLVASSGANLNYTVQNGHFNVNLNTSTKDFRVKDSGGSTVLNVTGDSKVGIGLTAPVETLHLSGSMRIDGAGTGTVQEQSGAPDTAYTNSSETNFYMGAPDRYLKIVLDGTTYLIPAYTPA